MIETLAPTVKIELSSLTMESLKELTSLKTFLLQSKEFERLFYIFNKNASGGTLTSGFENDDKINACRWSVEKKIPFIYVTHPQALKISSDIRQAMSKVGVDTNITTLSTRLSITDDDVSIVTLRNTLLFKVKENHQYNDLSTIQEQVMFVNERLRKHIRNELVAHQASDEVLQLVNQITLSGTSESIEKTLGTSNRFFHTSGRSVAKNAKQNQGAYRHGFRELTVQLPFRLQSKSFRVGIFKNSGFGTVWGAR
jgi:hypothetical protein